MVFLMWETKDFKQILYLLYKANTGRKCTHNFNLAALIIMGPLIEELRR